MQGVEIPEESKEKNCCYCIPIKCVIFLIRIVHIFSAMLGCYYSAELTQRAKEDYLELILFLVTALYGLQVIAHWINCIIICDIDYLER